MRDTNDPIRPQAPSSETTRTWVLLQPIRRTVWADPNDPDEPTTIIAVLEGPADADLQALELQFRKEGGLDALLEQLREADLAGDNPWDVLDPEETELVKNAFRDRRTMGEATRSRLAIAKDKLDAANQISMSRRHEALQKASSELRRKLMELSGLPERSIEGRESWEGLHRAFAAWLLRHGFHEGRGGQHTLELGNTTQD